MQATNGATHTFEAIPPLAAMLSRFGGDQPAPEYQELKFTLHRKLLDRINLEALSTMAGERMRIEAFVGLPDGSEWLRDGVEGDPAEPTLLGAELAKRLIDTGAREILDRAEKWTGRV